MADIPEQEHELVYDVRNSRREDDSLSFISGRDLKGDDVLASSEFVGKGLEGEGWHEFQCQQVGRRPSTS